MGVIRRFTEEEDRVILSGISENPENISKTLRELADELGRSYYSLNVRWYKYLSKRDERAFITYGQRNVNINRKVQRVDTQKAVKTKRSKWRKILDILFK